MKTRKLTALFLAAVTAASLSVSASAGYVKEGTTPLIDIKQSVKGRFGRDDDGYSYLFNEKNEKISGKSLVYLDRSGDTELGFDMRLLQFDKETGQYKDYYTGFTKDKNGRRYYNKGVRIIGWYKIGNSWYHFNKDGYADTGKAKIAGVRYTFDEKGKWTGKVAKSGVVPEDFSLKISNSLGSYGFSTDGTLSYGLINAERGEELYTKAIKISKRDRQVFWSMYQESGMESLNGTKLTEKYLYDVTLKSDYLKDAPETLVIMEGALPYSAYTVEVTVNGKKTVSEYETSVGEQLIHFDEAAYSLYYLTKNLDAYYKALKAKYPPKSDVEFVEYD